jgi:hypothetical protein
MHDAGVDTRKSSIRIQRAAPSPSIRWCLRRRFIRSASAEMVTGGDANPETIERALADQPLRTSACCCEGATGEIRMSMQRSALAAPIISAVFALHAGAVFAQTAGAGADFNKADRKETARQAEIQRVQKYDKPVRTDPVGNALLGGAVTGVVTGSATAAAATVVGRTATEATANKLKESKSK